MMTCQVSRLPSWDKHGDDCGYGSSALVAQEECGY